MTIKQQIQEDFITAMKSRDELSKSALTGLKSQILLAEKAEGKSELTQSDLIEVVSKSIRQREESHKIYLSAGREDLATKELMESQILRKYLPEQMSDNQIREALSQIWEELSTQITNPKALAGKTIGQFNKTFTGRADIENVKEILSQMKNETTS
ncbi:GatB/YqeY domain-containing protein [bacterium]|nr:GatB/YqeY domain-containing protein [Candidatus Elulimicrobium humile]